jgi:hypothetical protein
MTRHRLLAAALTAFTISAAGSAGALTPGGTFTDDDGSTHEGNIEAIRAEGITSGCNPPASDRYCPERDITRGQMAAFLVRALELPSSEVDAFGDDDGSPFEADIDALAAAGITRGCDRDGTRYCPDDPVTRGQMAAFLVRGFGYTEGGGTDRFTDDDGSTFEDDIDRLATAGVTVGCNPPANTHYCPGSPVRRGQMASFLARALDLAPILPPADYPWTGDSRIQQWRPLVETYFAPLDVEMALGIIRCESIGDPNAVNPLSGTSGLFQHRPSYWDQRYLWAQDWWADRGITIPAGGDIFDPEANIAVAGWLFDRDGIGAWDGCEPWVMQYFE